MKQYDVIIIGAGPGGIYSAWELAMKKPELKIAVFEKGRELEKRKCPIDGKKVKSCVGCKTCAIMNGFGGAGAFSDGKYNITNQFGGNLYEYIGKQEALDLMHYVDEINLSHGGEGTALYSTANTEIKKLCLTNGLHLLDASVRHLGTDINYVVLENLYLEDESGTVLFDANHVSAGFEILPLLNGRIVFSTVRLFGFSVNLHKETPADKLNLQFVIDAFASKDTVKKQSNIDLRFNSI